MMLGGPSGPPPLFLGILFKGNKLRIFFVSYKEIIFERKTTATVDKKYKEL